MIICHDSSSSTQSFCVIFSLIIWLFTINIPYWKLSCTETHLNLQLYCLRSPYLMTNSSRCLVLTISCLKHCLVLPLKIHRVLHPYPVSHGDYPQQLIAMPCNEVASPHTTVQPSSSALILGVPAEQVSLGLISSLRPPVQ